MPACDDVQSTAGMEMWHPNPFFFFEKGGGPVLDIGCYPITQLVNCLGPVESVVAHASKGRETRIVTSEPHKGREIMVEVPTTVNGVLALAGGANVSFTPSRKKCSSRKQRTATLVEQPGKPGQPQRQLRKNGDRHER